VHQLDQKTIAPIQTTFWSSSKAISKNYLSGNLVHLSHPSKWKANS